MLVKNTPHPSLKNHHYTSQSISMPFIQMKISKIWFACKLGMIVAELSKCDLKNDDR
jgi:hypothetical protein